MPQYRECQTRAVTVRLTVCAPPREGSFERRATIRSEFQSQLAFTMLIRSRKRLGVWLGLLAMCLALGVPVVSQWLAAQRSADAQIDAAFCTVAGLTQAVAADAGLGDLHGGAYHAQASDHGTHGDACDYCSLLANHPPLAMPHGTGAVSFVWIARAGPPAVAVPQFAQLAYTPPARAPPRFS